MTFQQMCETISYVWEHRDGTAVDPRAIFRYSPTGELYMLWEWYADAEGWLLGHGER